MHQIPRLFLVCLACLAALLASCGALRHSRQPAPVVRGPLATRQQHPMALTVMAFRPRRAWTQAEGETGYGVNLAYSSIEEIRRNPSYAPNESVVFDGETLRTTLRVRHGVGERTDIEVELPFLYASAGGLDSFIEEWHDFFALPGGSRELFPDDQYEMRVIEGGDVLYELDEEHFGVQDIPIFITHAVRREDEAGPALALRAGLELPTGSESRGYGNGELDLGFGLIGERSWGRWTFIGSLDVVFPGRPDRLSDQPDHDLRDQIAFGLGGEYRWNDRLSIVAGTTWTSPLLKGVSLEEIDREVFDLGLGFAWDVSAGGRMRASLHEDIVAATGSDLTAQFGWTWGF